MSIRPVWIVAFSSPRMPSQQVLPFDALRLEAGWIRDTLLEFRRSANEIDGDIELITCAASGADQIAIETANSMGLAVHLILPMAVTEFVEDFREKPLEWDRALEAIAKAGGLIGYDTSTIQRLCSWGTRKVLSSEWPPPPLASWSIRISNGSHEREACYHDCSQHMLELADALILIADPSSTTDLGGALDVLEQARARSLALAFRSIGVNQPVNIEWFRKPWTVDPIFKKMIEVARTGRGKREPSGDIQGMFQALDHVASHSGGRLKNRVTIGIAFQFLATILAAINSALLIPRLGGQPDRLKLDWDIVLIGSQVILVCQLVLVVVAFMLGLASRWFHLKSTWRQSRFGAEILRGLIQARGFVDPLSPIISRLNPSWHRFALASGLSAMRQRSVHELDWRQAHSRYLRERIEDQRDSYYQKLHTSASRVSSVCGRIGFWAGSFAPPFLMFAFYLKFFQPDWILLSPWSPLFVTFLPILLPLLAGASTSIKVVTDAGRRAERYRAMADRLQALGRWFPTLKTPSSIRRAVTISEEILLDELIEWYASSNSTGK